MLHFKVLGAESLDISTNFHVVGKSLSKVLSKLKIDWLLIRDCQITAGHLEAFIDNLGDNKTVSLFEIVREKIPQILYIYSMN